MESRLIYISILVASTTIVLDCLAFFAIRNYFKSIKKFFNAFFWGHSFLIILLYLYIITQLSYKGNEEIFNFFVYLNGYYLIFYVPKMLIAAFYILHLLIWGIIRIYETLNTRPQQLDNHTKISRLSFISKVGIVLAGLPFLSLMYGMIKGRFNYEVIRKKIEFENLPVSFEGLKIVQISDIHLGYLKNSKDYVQNIVMEINHLKPDLIFFTGDLVNNFATELKGWETTFSKLKANVGKFAILGNHDYGDYSHWESEKEKQQNFEKIKGFYAKTGFQLLLNESHTLARDREQITLIGVESWGKPPFFQYGDLNKAMKGVKNENFKILLLHDPNYWEAEALQKTDIDLSFAGHTHGMQVGFTYKDFTWSLAKTIYKYWGGLYEKNNQYLYVNRGLGYVAMPIRINMPPEITLVEIYRK